MKNLINKTLVSGAGLEAVILRVPIGLILAAHGSQKLFAWFGGFYIVTGAVVECQKLFAWFGGYGLEGTGQWMASVGLNPGFVMALLAGSAEFFGGIALILGLLTRVAAVINAVTMLVALFWVHWGHGFFLDTHGIEYALALFSASAALVLIGGGRYSLDRYLLDANLLGAKDE